VFSLLLLLIAVLLVSNGAYAQPQLYVRKETSVQGATLSFFEWVYYLGEWYTLKVWIGNREDHSNLNLNITIRIQGDNLKIAPSDSEQVIFNLMNDWIEYDFQVEFTKEGSQSISIELFYQDQKIDFDTINVKVVQSNTKITLLNLYPTAVVIGIALACGIFSLEDEYKREETSTKVFAVTCGVILGFFLAWYYLSIVSFDSIKFLLVISFLADLYCWFIAKDVGSSTARFAAILVFIPLVFEWLEIPAIVPVTLPQFLWQIIQAVIAGIIAYFIDKIFKKK